MPGRAVQGVAQGFRKRLVDDFPQRVEVAAQGVVDPRRVVVRGG